MASWLFTQLFLQARIEQYIKAARHWPLWGEFTGDGNYPNKGPASNEENERDAFLHKQGCELNSIQV